MVFPDQTDFSAVLARVASEFTRHGLPFMVIAVRQCWSTVRAGEFSRVPGREEMATQIDQLAPTGE